MKASVTANRRLFATLTHSRLTIKEDKNSKSLSQKVFLSSGFLLLSFSSFLPKAGAQIVPDATLPVNSTVTPQGNTSVIEGGTSAGTNLFHSFQQFSIPTNGTAYFNNAADIQNILTRVTGGSISNIDGLIQANGTANLFLINPNGIIFGPNAALNIGGSFLASTASQINFADGTQFNATSPQTTPLLTVSVPVGLQMGPNPGSIVVQGSGHNLSIDPETGAIIRDNRPVGLQVAAGQTLALLGGNVALEGGNLTAEGGRIELGSVGPETLVTLTPINPGMALSYPGINNFQDISLSRAASVDASGAGGGDVFVAGRRVTLTDGSSILALTEGDKGGGTLSVRASEVVEVIGTAPDGQYSSRLFATVQPGATGEGGNVTIETARLRVADGAAVSASTFGSGNAGNLTVQASDTVEVIGTRANGQSSSGLQVAVAPGATGEGGNLTIETARLRVADGAQVSTSTFGPGKAGNLMVKATDTVEVIGTSTDSQYASGLYASAQPGATGEGGNLTIETARLRVVDGAQVGTDTFGPGKAGNLTVNASDTVEVIGIAPSGQYPSGLGATAQRGATGEGGNLTIETARLRVADGAYVTATTFGSGKGGNLTVKATDTVEVIGTTPNGQYPTALNAAAATGATGEGCNLTIETARLRIIDGAIATARSRGEGKAGNLRVDADSIGLSNSSNLTAETSAGGGTIELRSPSITLRDGSSISTNAQGGESGGNIDVRSSALILRQGSRITTNATGSQVTGGNMAVNTDVIAAIENSDISANSEDARGGNITINAQAIFGSVFRTPEDLERLLNTSDPLLLDPARLPSSDITATGADSSLSGTVSVNTPNVDPAQGLLNLPETPVDATQLVASTCRRGKNQSEFNVTGRGGLPPNPYEAIADEATWIDLRPIAGERANSRTEEQIRIAGNRQDSATSPIQLIEAQGWIINSKGQVELIAQVPGASPHNPRFTQQQCPLN